MHTLQGAPVYRCLSYLLCNKVSADLLLKRAPGGTLSSVNNALWRRLVAGGGINTSRSMLHLLVMHRTWATCRHALVFCTRVNSLARPFDPPGAVAESVEHGSRVRAIMGSNQTNNLSS